MEQNLQKLTIERATLKERIDKYVEYLSSDEYKEQSDTERMLVVSQIYSMRATHTILQMRVAHLIGKLNREDDERKRLEQSAENQKVCQVSQEDKMKLLQSGSKAKHPR